MNQALGTDVLERALAERTRANRAFFEAEAERLARLCHRMAERFARGGRLIAFGRSPAARSDARHVAVEFVHPVIVGKRALPAIGLARGGRPARAAGASCWPSPTTSRSRSAPTSAATRPAIGVARERGCLTHRLRAAPGAEWEFEPPADGPVGPPGARRDALPRALGARARVLRPPRPARGPRGAAGARHRRVELPLSVPRRAGARPRGGGRRTCGARCSPRRRRSASCARRRSPRTRRRLRRPRPRPARTTSTAGGQAARARQRRLGHGRDGRGGRLPPPPDPRWPPRRGARPHRGRGDPDRDRERHRHRGDLLAPGDRLRARAATRCSRSPRAATPRT